MITLNTNLASLIVQSNLQKSTNALNTAIERMTSGYKINGAKDNAANYSITTNMSTKIGAYQVAEDNVAMGLDLLSTASENLDLISDKLTRLRALAEQSANGTYGTQSKQAINAEANALVDEIERLYNTTEYNGIKLYEGEKPEGGHDAVIPADAQRVSEVTSFTGGKTYKVSTKEDLIALQDLTNSGKGTTGANFVMTNDIDMSGVDNFSGIGPSSNSFQGTFNGNGYAVKNLTINQPEDACVGLFGVLVHGVIKNLGLENCNVTGDYHVGGLVGVNAEKSIIENCYMTNGNISGNNRIGCLVGFNCATIQNCYAEGSVVGNICVGGLAGASTNSKIENSIVLGSVDGESEVGAIVGDFDTGTITNSFANVNRIGMGIIENMSGHTAHGTLTNTSSISLSELTNSLFMQSKGYTEANGWYTKDGYTPQLTPFAPDVNIGLQVGIDSSENSSIGLTTSFGLSLTSLLRGIGKGEMDYLSMIDNMLNSVSSKQTQYGAVQNRLDSSLEEISTQYENLVSSRSTLRDADISEVSSEYIRQQILQQASATLLATANQSPSLALQLL